MQTEEVQSALSVIKCEQTVGEHPGRLVHRPCRTPTTWLHTLVRLA